MSLARTLMNGGYIGTLEANINPARYGHAQGASVIAMESVEELHDIFLENYNYEQADLAAAIEGVALEGSQYEAVAEASIKSVFTKIKEFLSKLWAKVKAFFHEVKRYLDSIFMSGKEFAKKYEKEIRKIDDLEDFEYKMFAYSNKELDDVDSYISRTADDVTNWNGKLGRVNLTSAVNAAKANVANGYSPSPRDNSSTIDGYVNMLRADDIDDKIVSIISDGKCTSSDDFDEYCFGLWRNGATRPEDKELEKVTTGDIDTFRRVLADSKADKLDKVQSVSDRIYRDAIKLVENREKEISNNNKNGENKEASAVAALLRAYSSFISKNQTYMNNLINSWKEAIKERDNTYKSVIVAAFAYDKKQTKKKNK